MVFSISFDLFSNHGQLNLMSSYTFLNYYFVQDGNIDPISFHLRGVCVQGDIPVGNHVLILGHRLR